MHRIMESGLQSRSSQRVLASLPKCAGNVAMFAAVSLGDVAPAFKCLLLIYTLAIVLFVLELIVHSRKLDKSQNKTL